MFFIQHNKQILRFLKLHLNSMENALKCKSAIFQKYHFVLFFTLIDVNLRTYRHRLNESLYLQNCHLTGLNNAFDQ